MVIMVSACLLGICCRYDCKIKKNKDVCTLLSDNVLIPICPEQLGGRPTPRIPTEIKNGHVIDKNGNDLTDEFVKGGLETLKIARLNNVKIAILKSKSPSCGFGKVYDGTFSNNLIDGNGITADILNKNEIKIFNETNFMDIF